MKSHCLIGLAGALALTTTTLGCGSASPSPESERSPGGESSSNDIPTRAPSPSTPEDGETTPPAGPGGEPPKADANDCGKLGELAAPSTTTTFRILDTAAGVAVPVMAGGKLDGKYRVEKSTVYLPASVKSVVRLPTSTGKVESWFAFSGKSFRMHVKGDISVDSIIGPQTRATAVDGEGTYHADGSKFIGDTSCTGAPQEEGEITFSAQGDRATFLLKQTQAQGDVYIALDAVRVP